MTTVDSVDHGNLGLPRHRASDHRWRCLWLGTRRVDRRTPASSGQSCNGASTHMSQGYTPYYPSTYTPGLGTAFVVAVSVPDRGRF